MCIASLIFSLIGDFLVKCDFDVNHDVLFTFGENQRRKRTFVQLHITVGICMVKITDE